MTQNDTYSIYDSLKAETLDFYSLSQLKEIAGELHINGEYRDGNYWRPASRDDFITVIKRKLLKHKQSKIRKKIPQNNLANFAKKRLMRDLKEIKQSDLRTVYAMPLQKNIFEWHVNLLAPESSKYYGSCFHLILTFNETYPFKPPACQILTSLSHSHVMGDRLCLDLLETHGAEASYFGWSSGYSVLSILRQLQSFLLEEEEQTHFKYVYSHGSNSLSYNCKKCKHCIASGKPWPWPKTFPRPGKLKGRLNHAKKESKRIENVRKLQLNMKKKMKRKGEYEKRLEKYLNEDVKRKIGFKLLRIKVIQKVGELKIQKEVLKRKKSMEISSYKLRIKEINKKMRFEEKKISDVRKGNYKILNEFMKTKEFLKSFEAEKKMIEELKVRKIDNINESLKRKNMEESDSKYLPRDILFVIFSYLSKKQLVNMSLVSLEWKLVAFSPIFWDKSFLICYYSKQSFNDDVLGYGINFTFSRSSGMKKILKISPSLDFLSYTSFTQEMIRQDVWNNPFTHWMPLYITPKHWNSSVKHYKELIHDVYGTYHIVYSIDLVLKLMSSMIVMIMDGKKHASIKALEGYCHFYRILLHFVIKNKQLKNAINLIIKKFINNKSFRHKTVVPSLGELIPLVSISKYSWKDICNAFIEEALSRNCLWMRIDNEKIEELLFSVNDSDSNALKVFLNGLYEKRKVSSKLIMFHVSFLHAINISGHKSVKDLKFVAKEFDKRFGNPPKEMTKYLQKQIFDIEKVNSFSEYFQFCGVKFNNKDNVNGSTAIISDKNVLNILKNAWTNALYSNYFQKQWTPPHLIRLDLKVVSDGYGEKPSSGSRGNRKKRNYKGNKGYVRYDQRNKVYEKKSFEDYRKFFFGGKKGKNSKNNRKK